MPRKPKTTKKLDRHDPGMLQTGVELVVKDNFPIRKAASRVNIPHQTLNRYVKRYREATNKDTVSYEPNYANRTVLTTELESQLHEYLVQAADLAYGLSTKECRKLAYQLAANNNCKYPPAWDQNQAAGKDWMMGFLKRHPLSLRKPESCSYARNVGFNKPAVNVFYNNLEKVLQNNPKLTDPSRIFNLDETGTTTHLTPERFVLIMICQVI